MSVALVEGWDKGLAMTSSNILKLSNQTKNYHGFLSNIGMGVALVEGWDKGLVITSKIVRSD